MPKISTLGGNYNRGLYIYLKTIYMSYLYMSLKTKYLS